MNNDQKLQRIARKAIGNPLATVTKHTQAPQHLADPETGDLRSGYVLDDQSGYQSGVTFLGHTFDEAAETLDRMDVARQSSPEIPDLRYHIALIDNTGALDAVAIAASVDGLLISTVDGYNESGNDLAIIEVAGEQQEHMERILEDDPNVVSYHYSIPV